MRMSEPLSGRFELRAGSPAECAGDHPLVEEPLPAAARASQSIPNTPILC